MPAPKLKRPLFSELKNNRGIALIVAIAALIFIMYIAMEVSYDSNVEYLVNSQHVQRIKAYYAAKSAINLSLLRIKIYQTVKNKFGSQLGPMASMVDQIWQFPFAWPLPISSELNAVDKDTFKKLTKESFFDSNYLVTIEDEGSKIDLSDLVSVSQPIRENAHRLLLGIFEQRLKSDEEFQKKYSNQDFNKLINSIADWMSSKNESLNGGDKRGPFSSLNQGAYMTLYPPNRPFRTLDEIRLVPEMNDDFFSMISPVITIYGMKAINPNTAKIEVLKSLDPGITDEVAKEIIKRRDNPNEGGPFKAAKDFWDFVSTSGARLVGEVDKIPLVFEGAYNFRIRATGTFANSTQEIEVVTFDLNQYADKQKEIDEKQKQQQSQQQEPTNPQTGPNQQTGQQNQQKPKEPLPKGPPRIVYWSER